MPSRIIQQQSTTDRRAQALSRLTGRSGLQGTPSSASAALGVLHELASSPETAAGALALLHELQVHQVELELQDEELRNARDELEAALQRQTQLYDFAPVACFTIEHNTTVVEANLGAARLLDGEREALLGRTLDSLLEPHSRHALQALLARASQGQPGASSAAGAAGMLQLLARDGRARRVQASVSVDPAGPRYLVAFIELDESAPPA